MERKKVSNVPIQHMDYFKLSKIIVAVVSLNGETLSIAAYNESLEDLWCVKYDILKGVLKDKQPRFLTILKNDAVTPFINNNPKKPIGMILFL